MKNIVQIACVFILIFQSISVRAEVSSVFILYEKDGLQYEDSARKRLFTGLYMTYWDENKTKKKSSFTFRKGVIEGWTMKWHENGHKRSRGYIQDGTFNGIVTIWHNNGKKKSEATYKENKAWGLSKRWYESGQKRMEIYLEANKPSGRYVAWRENGRKIGEIDYGNGKNSAEDNGIAGLRESEEDLKYAGVPKFSVHKPKLTTKSFQFRSGDIKK